MGDVRDMCEEHVKNVVEDKADVSFV